MAFNANLYAAFAAVFAKHGERVALRTETGEAYRYKDLERESARLGRFLLDAGLAVGDRVSVQVAKSPQALCLYLACLRAGLVFHPLNPAYRQAELEFFLADASPAVVVGDPADLSTLERLCAAAEVPHLYTLDARGGGSLTDGAGSSPADCPVADRADDDLAALLYSSGTTGRPKGIMLSHRNLRSNAEVLCEYWGFSESDVLLHALPVFHVHGLFVASHCTLLAGASMNWLPAFDVQGVLEKIPESTVMMGVPTYYVRLLDDPRFTAAICRNMRLFISGSAPLLEETFQAFQVRTGHTILERYGMTETGMNSSNPLAGERRGGTVGLALPGTELRVVDGEDAELPAGEVGRLQVRGPNVFRGYWQLPEKTAADFTADGFFDTGDQGMIEDDGYLRIVGRAKDMVISGGLNVYPKEIELLLDDVEAVRESAVIGVPHRDFGEAVVAVLVGDAASGPSEAEVIADLKERLSGFKVPKRVLWIDALPRNAMGKVQKNQLRETYAELFS